MSEEVQRVRCIHCLNETAEITANGLKCVHPYCKREWSFDYELEHYKHIQKVVGRNIVRQPGKKKVQIVTPSVSRRSVRATDKESEEKTDDD